MESRLLDKLSKSCDCFISELKYIQFCSSNVNKLLNIPFEDYDLEDCNYSFSYIYNKPMNFNNYEEIRKYLSNKM